MLERVALHRKRFRTPGVSPDGRGVLLGERGLLVFSSLDRLVAFLRAFAQQGSIDELLTSLELKQLVTPLKTREVMLSVQAESSYRMDLLASVARLADGLVFTGTSRHFVRYRDQASPLGYDVSELVRESADLIVYDESYQQTYTVERDIDLRQLLLRLDPMPAPRARDDVPSALWATAETGVGGALIGYLHRWGVEASVGLVEWPPASAFDDRGVRLHLFRLVNAPPRIVSLLVDLPGVTVYAPAGERVAVELHYQHPVALESCQSLFGEESLTLLPGRGEARIVEPLPALAPVGALVRAQVMIDDEVGRTTGTAAGEVPPTALPLRLAPATDPWRNVVGTVVAPAEREWLARVLYALPPESFAGLRVAFAEDGTTYLLNERGIEGVPVGEFVTEVTSRVYVPAGFKLVPAVAPSVLLSALSDKGDAHVFFARNRAPVRIEDHAFADASRALIQAITTRVVSAAAPQEEPDLGLFQYAEARRLPLFGLPGRGEAAADGPGEPET